MRVILAVMAFCMLVGQGLAETQPLARYHATVVNGNRLGSSFELQDGLVATNAHVVKGRRVGASVQLVVQGRHQPVRAVVLAVSSRMDLALLRATPDLLTTPRTRAAQRRSEPLQLVGVVASRGPRAVRSGTGYVVQKRVSIPRFGRGMILRTSGVTFGFSGGPVFNSNGQVVGMLTALRTRSSRTEALVISISEIHKEANRMLQGL